MDKIARIGVDLAKNLIVIHGVDRIKKCALTADASRSVCEPPALPGRDGSVQRSPLL